MTVRFICWLTFLYHPLPDSKISAMPKTPFQGSICPKTLLFSFWTFSQGDLVHSHDFHYTYSNLYFYFKSFFEPQATLSTAYKTSPSFNFKTPGEALYWLEMTISETMNSLKKNETELDPSKYELSYLGLLYLYKDNVS